MLQVNYKEKTIKDFKESPEPVNKDIFVQRISYEIDYDENGVRTETPKIELVNLTRKINETAKILNELNAEERIKKLEEIIEKEN